VKIEGKVSGTDSHIIGSITHQRGEKVQGDYGKTAPKPWKNNQRHVTQKILNL
jgi:hypothetical protein